MLAATIGTDGNPLLLGIAAGGNQIVRAKLVAGARVPLAAISVLPGATAVLPVSYLTGVDLELAVRYPSAVVVYEWNGGVWQHGFLAWFPTDDGEAVGPVQQRYPAVEQVELAPDGEQRVLGRVLEVVRRQRVAELDVFRPQHGRQRRQRLCHPLAGHLVASPGRGHEVDLDDFGPERPGQVALAFGREHAGAG